MSKIDLSLRVSGVSIDGAFQEKVDLAFETTSEDVLDQIPADMAVDFYSPGALLDEIGVEEVKEYFGLVEYE